MTPPSRTGSRPVRALIALAAIIVIMLISVLGNETLSPGKWHQQFKVGLGLDLSSGTEVVLKAETHDGKAPASGEMQQAIAVEQSRVDRTGTSGAQVQQQGSDTINVTVPGKPSYGLVNVVSRSSQLSVRPVYLEAPYVPPSAANTRTVTYGDAALVNAATLKLFGKEVCTPGRDASTVNPSWQKTVGYSPSGDQWGALKARSCPATRAGPSMCLAKPPTWAATSRQSTRGCSRTAPSGWWTCRSTTGPPRSSRRSPPASTARTTPAPTAAIPMTRRSTRPRSSSTAT